MNNLKKVLLILVAVNILHAGDFETNKFTPMQKFYYEMGVEKTKKEFYEKGYETALKDFLFLLNEYEGKIKSIEASKYLLETSKIAYPEIYKTRTRDGGYQIHIEAPVVEKEFSSEDLFIVPLMNQKKFVRSVQAKVEYPSPEVDITDSFSIPSMSQRQTDIPTSPKDITNKVFVDINYKSSTIKEFLDTYDAKYSVSEKGYKIEFDSESDKRKFCIDLTGEPTCYGLN